MSHEINPNALLACPYDSNHKVAAHKLQAHIIKCRRSHPELEGQFEHCPFNAVHVIRKSEREEHILTCVDKHRILKRTHEIPKCDITIPVYKNTVNTVDEEDWDKEAEVDVLKPTIEPKKPDPQPDNFQKLTDPSKNDKKRKSLKEVIAMHETIIQEVKETVTNNQSQTTSVYRIETERKNLSIGRGVALKNFANKKLRTGN